MKYNLDWAKQAYESGTIESYIFFWGHTPKTKNGRIHKTCFSQWWEGVFEVDGILYKSAEHWMMAKKAKTFSDTEMYQKIIEAKTPAEAKRLGRKVRNFDHAIWDKVCYEIVKEGNLHKFGKSTKLKDYLLGTGNSVLVEASPLDTIWGIGLTQDAPNIENPNTWLGSNLLGFVLMEVRDELKKATI
ncbi:MAG: NADAR family protein [Chitinophagales bacterium]